MPDNRLTHILGRGPRQLAQRLFRRRARDRIVLLLRLENLELLAERLGQTGIAHVFAQLSMRMTDTIRPNDFVQSRAPGVYAILLRTRSEVEALRIATRLQQHCQMDIPTNSISVSPVISGVLVQNIGDRHIPIRHLMACGMRQLRNTAPADLGRIRLIAQDDGALADDIPATVAEACRQGQIEAYFQPQLCCDTGNVTGFEALARWNHPVRGVLSPHFFIPGMDRADHGALTRTMLRQSLEALQLWDAQGWQIGSVSLNVPQSELSEPGFVDMVLWELDRHSIRHDRLVIEVLESIGPINSSEQIRINLARLSEVGCLLDLDDFGTGYAGLDSLRQFGVSRIKIDREFVSRCNIDPRQQRMVRAILALADKLGMKALAEGVETREEHSYLAQLGCGYVQGFVVARPMPLSQVGGFMTRYLESRPSLPDLTKRRAG